jgi:hypothetical protein
MAIPEADPEAAPEAVATTESLDGASVFPGAEVPFVSSPVEELPASTGTLGVYLIQTAPTNKPTSTGGLSSSAGRQGRHQLQLISDDQQAASSTTGLPQEMAISSEISDVDVEVCRVLASVEAGSVALSRDRPW